MIIVVILVPILMFSLVGAVTYHFIKKSNRGNKENLDDVETGSAQSFIPIETVKNGCVVLKNGKIRKIIECSSLNYGLKTDEEQVSIEMMFQQFINSINFPISFFMQTRLIDNKKRMDSLVDDVAVTVEKFPALEDYGNLYVNAMKNINKEIGNTKEKKKYIIIPFDDGLDIEALTNSEKREYVERELDNRCSIVLNGLTNLGIRAEVLDNQNIIELMYSTFYRNNYRYHEHLSEEEALAVIIEGQHDSFKESDYSKDIINALNATINQYQRASGRLTDKMKQQEEMLIRIKEEMRQEAHKSGRD